jgi:RHS repeat-associated protein
MLKLLSCRVETTLLITEFIQLKSVMLSLLLLLFGLLQSSFAQAPPRAGVPSAYQGSTTVGSYPLSGLDNINYFNGNLDFNLPLVTLGGRGEASFTMMLTIGQIGWNVNTIRGQGICDPSQCIYNYTYNPTKFPPPGVAKAGLGPGYLVATSTGTYDLTDCSPKGFNERLTTITFAMPGGSAVEFRDDQYKGKPLIGNSCGTGDGYSRGTVFKSVDGSGMTVISDTALVDKYEAQFPGISGYLYMKNGVRYRFDGGKVTRINDRNGNWIAFVHSDLGYVATDSIGRQVSVQRAIDSNNTTITMTRSGNISRTIKLYIENSAFDGISNLLRSDYQLLTEAQAFPQLNGAGSGAMGITGITKVELPDGRSYRFKYNSYNELARVELPTGGAYEYEWSGLTASGRDRFNTRTDDPRMFYGYIRRWATERRVYENGATGANYTTRTTITNLANGFNSAKSVKEYVGGVTDPISRTDHFFYGNPNDSISVFKPYYNEGWNTGIEYQTDVYAGDGTQFLRRTQNTYQAGASFGWCTGCGIDPRLMQTVNTLTDTNQVSQQTFRYDSFNNQTDIYEYDFGSGAPGALKRHTYTDYLTTNPVNSINYTGTNIYLRSLPVSTWIAGPTPPSSGAIPRPTIDPNPSPEPSPNPTPIPVPEYIYSRTDFEYDNYTSGGGNAALLGRTNVVGHDTTNYGGGYLTRGNVTKVTSYENATNQTGAISTYANYDILGNVVKTINAKGYVSTIDYSDRFGSPDNEARSNTAPTQLNGQNTFAFPTAITNVLGWTVYAQVDYFTGQPVNTEDINGTISKTNYIDLLDRPTQSVTAIGTSFERQSNIIYDDANHRVEAKGDLFALNDNLSKSESFYDGLGRTIESRKYESDGGYVISKSVPFLMMQDPETSVWRVGTKQSNPYRPGAGEQAVWTTALSDALGRSIKTITPDGAIVKIEYSGNTATATDQAGKKRRSVTNALGQLTRVDEPNNAGGLDVGGVPIQPTNYAYDTLGNLTSVQQVGTNAEQCGSTTTSCTQTRSFVYDSLSRLKSATNPESGTMNYVYDNNDNLTQKKDARLVITDYVYDNLNRVTNRNYSAPAGLPNYQATPNVSYTYENTTVTNLKGVMTKVTNSFSATEYTQFDTLGRVLKSRQTTDGTVYNPMEYVYNLSGAMVEQKYPSGRVVKNTLDADGDLSQVQSQKANGALQNYANSFNYTAAGAVSSMRLGNGRWENTIFNSRLQPTQIGLGASATSQNTLKLNFTYNTPNQNDNNGNVLSQTITVPTVGATAGFTAIQTYTYDSLNRIKDAKEMIGTTQQWKQTFLYDRYGNRRFDTANNNTTTLVANCLTAVCNPTIDPATNKLVGYQFDNSGNTKVDANNRQFIYDAENKQVEVRDSANNVVGKYFYDGDGKRVKKISNTETTVFVYNANGQLVAEYSTQISQQPQVSYLTNDHLGSPRITTDANGQVISRRDFQPFGEEIARANYGTDNVRQKFTSYERDNETGLDYAKARFHNSNLGRFQSPDRYSTLVLLSNSSNLSLFAVQPQNWNGYLYCRNNPMKYVDSDGQHPAVAALIPGAIGAVVGGLIGGGIEYGRQAYKGEETDWSKIGGAAAQGAIFGAVSAYIGPAGLALRGVPAYASLIGANTVGGVTNRAISGGEPLNGRGIIVDAASGAGAAYLSSVGQTRYFNSYAYQTTEPARMAQEEAVEVLLASSPIPGILPTLTRPVFQEAIKDASYNGVREGLYVGAYRSAGKVGTQSTLNFLFNFDTSGSVQSASNNQANINNNSQNRNLKLNSNCVSRPDGKGQICISIID